MKRILAALLPPTLAAPAWGQNFDKGMQAYEQRDYATALRELRPLAEQGLAEAQSNFGVMYDTGRGVPQDDDEAAKWYRKGAEQNLPGAQENLGVFYARGRGVPQNYVQALLWLNLAAEQGSKDAIKNRDIIAKRVTPAQIAEAQKLAREWLAAFEKRKKE